MAVTRIKICGITRLEDALCAVESGADAIGLVFCRSPRQLDVSRAQAIIQAIPPFITTVALFQNNTQAEVDNILNHLRLDLLQFHGSEASVFCEQFGVSYIKALPMLDNIDVVQAAEKYSHAKGILLDATAADEQGGSGKTFDWQKVPQQLGKPLIMAGGLDVDNVADCIRRTHCYAVDVSSGVEAAKGIKDAQKINAFIRNVKQTDRDLSN